MFINIQQRCKFLCEFDIPLFGILLHDVLYAKQRKAWWYFWETWRTVVYFGNDLFGKHVVNYSFFIRFPWYSEVLLNGLIKICCSCYLAIFSPLDVKGITCNIEVKFLRILYIEERLKIQKQVSSGWIFCPFAGGIARLATKLCFKGRLGKSVNKPTSAASGVWSTISACSR